MEGVPKTGEDFDRRRILNEAQVNIKNMINGMMGQEDVVRRIMEGKKEGGEPSFSGLGDRGF